MASDLAENASLSAQQPRRNATSTKRQFDRPSEFPQHTLPHIPTAPSTAVSDTASPETDIPSPGSTGCQSTRRGWQASGGAPWTPPSAFHQQRDNLAHGLDMGTSGERLGFDFLLDGRHHISKLASRQSNDPPNSHHSQIGMSSPGLDRVNLMPLPDSHSPHDGNGRSPRSSAPHMDGYPTYQSGTPLVAHSAPIRNINATCPLDSLLLDFLAERQKQAAEGVSSRRLVGPAYPSVSSLLNPDRSIYSHPVSKVFTDILATFPDLSNLPEQVAVLFIMFLIMRVCKSSVSTAE